MNNEETKVPFGLSIERAQELSAYIVAVTAYEIVSKEKLGPGELMEELLQEDFGSEAERNFVIYVFGKINGSYDATVRQEPDLLMSTILPIVERLHKNEASKEDVIRYFKRRLEPDFAEETLKKALNEKDQDFEDAD